MAAGCLKFWQCFGLAFVLDSILGDPLWMPHPVRLMGAIIGRLEKPFRRLPVNETISGAFFALFLVASVFALTWVMLLSAGWIHPWLRSVLEVMLLYWCMAAKSLDLAAGEVERRLLQDDIKIARKELSMIVGRDTENLTFVEICRAAIETVAENLSDGVISPFFWMAVGGAPAAMAFKMISTLDSMVGYNNARYRLFGRVSARLDDAANFIPARLSVFVIFLAARILKLNANAAFITALREGMHHVSPNAGYPEAAFAGALGVRLNGPAVYGGKVKEKPFIGAGLGDPGIGHLRAARSLLRVSSFMGAVLTIFILFIFQA